MKNTVDQPTSDDLPEPDNSKMQFGFFMQWSQSDGTKTSAFVCGCDTSDDSIIKCVEVAKSIGWTPARWWQWWRWNDKRVATIVASKGANQ